MTCLPVPRGTVADNDWAFLSLLTVRYTYWPDPRDKGETKTGEMYLFGDYDSLDTQNFLLREFALRHPSSRVCDFSLLNKQP